MAYKLNSLSRFFSAKLLPAAALLALSFTTISSFATQIPTQNKSKFQRDSTILYFKPDGRLLYQHYKTNDAQLSAILNFAEKNAKDLQNGLSHINIISYIKESQINNPQAINNASIQASIVRAQFKTRFNIPHSSITFYIDTTQNINNAVRVDYINTPIPLYSNSEIFYTESTSEIAAKAQMNKYKPSVPYTNYFMRLSKLNPQYNPLGELATLDNQQLPEVAKYDAKTETTIIQQDIKEQSEIPAPLPIEPEQLPQTPYHNETPIIAPVPVLPPAAGQPTSNNITPPSQTPTTTTKTTKTTRIKTPQEVNDRGFDVFGLKTNLLFWAAAVPNLQMEFYAGQRISINLEGAYTWGWFLPTDKAYYGWNASGEIRVWLKGQKQFTGHFLGAYGGAGQYDFKFSQLGFQGDFFQAGISYGYMLPISKNFYMEFSLGVGVLGYSQNNYENVDGRNVSVEKLPYKRFYGPNKANISILWKF